MLVGRGSVNLGVQTWRDLATGVAIWTVSPSLATVTNSYRQAMEAWNNDLRQIVEHHRMAIFSRVSANHVNDYSKHGTLLADPSQTFARRGVFN